MTSNRGRSTTTKAQTPYYPGAPSKEAAKHLRLTVTRYINERASLREVEEAMIMLRAVAPVAGDAGEKVPPRTCGAKTMDGRECVRPADHAKLCRFVGIEGKVCTCILRVYPNRCTAHPECNQ